MSGAQNSAGKVTGNMRIEIEDKGSYQLIRCSGILNGVMQGEASEAIHPLIEKHQRVLIDLSGVDRITTQGIGAFVTLVSRAKANVMNRHIIKDLGSSSSTRRRS